MRIAHVSDFYLPRLGGIEMHIHDLASRQQAAGHDVEVITATPRPASSRGPVEECGRTVHRLTESAFYPSALHPAGLPLGRRLIRDGKYDLVHVHIGVVSPLAFATAHAAANTALPTVVTVHSMLSYCQPAFKALDVAARWSAWPVVWTAVSDVAATPIRRLVGRDRPVIVLPNGIDPEEWRVTPAPRDPREVVVVAVMRLASRKRPRHLLRALRRARAQVPASTRLRAVVVGEGPQRPALERYLRRHDMAGWVSLPGRFHRSEIRALFEHADLFVAPATLESFGIAALEARCAGLPVIARAQSGVREFVSDGREGILVNSELDLSDAIARLAADPTARQEIANHNRAVPPPVTWEHVLRMTDDAYAAASDLASRPAGPTSVGMAG